MQIQLFSRISSTRTNPAYFQTKHKSSIHSCTALCSDPCSLPQVSEVLVTCSAAAPGSRTAACAVEPVCSGRPAGPRTRCVSSQVDGWRCGRAGGTAGRLPGRRRGTRAGNLEGSGREILHPAEEGREEDVSAEVKTFYSSAHFNLCADLKHCFLCYALLFISAMFFCCFITCLCF